MPLRFHKVEVFLSNVVYGHVQTNYSKLIKTYVSVEDRVKIESPTWKIGFDWVTARSLDNCPLGCDRYRFGQDGHI